MTTSFLGHLRGVFGVFRSFVWRSISDVPTIVLRKSQRGRGQRRKKYIFPNQDRGGHHERVQDAHRYNAQAASNLSCGGRDGEKLERKECTKVLSPIVA